MISALPYCTVKETCKGTVANKYGPRIHHDSPCSKNKSSQQARQRMEHSEDDGVEHE